MDADSKRRVFLKKTAVVAGGAAIGALGLYEVLKPKAETYNPSSQTASLDVAEAYAYLGPAGDILVQRDINGRISTLTYGPLMVQISRNQQGTVATVETSISLSSLGAVKQIDTINRNTDGSISGVSRQRPS